MSEQNLLNTFYEWQKGWWLYDEKYIEKTLSNDHVTIIGTASNEYMLDKVSVINAFKKLIESRVKSGGEPTDFDKTQFKVRSIV